MSLLALSLFKKNGILYFGADSISTTSHNMMINKDSKVFKRNSIIFGSCGYIRPRNLLKYTLEIPIYTSDRDPVEYLVNDFIEAVRSCFKAKGVNQSGEKVKIHLMGDFFWGFQGEIYLIGGEYNPASIVATLSVSA